MSEHVFLVGMLALHLIGLVVIGYMGFRVHQASQRIEGITAAVYLEACKVLGRPR
ncbi:MAG: hypothetical protein HYS77_05690 [Candidatus Rokubacteria bacterium]|nr:hypothetical protein [Candidatus Rokubacteria bacterium]